MRKLVMALALGLVPGLAFAQQTERGARAEMRGPPKGGHAAVLLEQRAALELTDEQVTKLEAIAASLETRNAPFLAEMDKLRADGVRPRDLPDAEREALRTTMQNMRDNNRAARDEAQAVLTGQQREKAQTLMRERMRDRRGTGMRGDRRGPPGGGPAQQVPRTGGRRGSI